MVVITLECPFLSIGKKEIIVKEFTQSVCEHIGIPSEEVIIFIREDPNENMAQGGIILSEKLRSII
ncbi:MAG: tautomerase family protein [Mariniphaga sp.]